MMKDYPYFRLYTSKVLQETRRLSLEQKGKYLEDLIDMWIDGDINSMSDWMSEQVQKLGVISEARSNSAKKRWEVKVEQPKLLSAPKEPKQKAERKPKVVKEFVAPTLEDALAYGREYHKTNPNFTCLDPVRAWFENRKNADWCNSYGKPIINWKNDVIAWITRGIKNEPRSL